MLNRAIASLLWMAGYAVSLLSLRVLYFITDMVFLVGYYLISYRRSVIVQNLSRAFPDMKYKEIAAISRAYTRHFFNLFAEWIKLTSISQSALNKLVQYQNVDIIQQYSDKGQNVILVMGHYGNWEALNLLPTRVDLPVYAIYKKQSSQIINKVGVWMRIRFGVRLLEKKEATRFILRNKLTPAIYVFIADQSPSAHVKESFSFLHQPTTAFAGVEKLAAAIQAVVIYMEVMPVRRGEYHVNFRLLSKDLSVTAGFLHELEKSIIQSPQYWLWSHRRWKHTVE